ncbi:MAG: LuxR C-terminal-related transcriptional regulator [Thermomicrobiales bacterium]
MPNVQADLIVRSRVVELLDEGLRRRLTLVSAPAGFGKTTLVSSWIHSAPPDDYAIAWLSLDERDNDLERFLSYFIESLRLASPGVGDEAEELLGAAVDTQPEMLLISLINNIGSVSGQIVLVLDDYHLIENPAIHELMDFFIDNVPGQIHVVITCRADPPLSLSRWRGRREMVEIRAEDLRFNDEEAERFLRVALGQDIGADHVHELEERTEGWITGLQLVAISLRGRDDVEGFIRSFSGQHHHIFDYLVDEVLERESPETQDFLLRTSLFGQFSAGLCDAVTGRRDSHAVLDYLDRSNLFIAALDSDRRWFRYHHLFADLLRRKLRLTLESDIPELRRRASVWFEEEGDTVEAIWQSINGEDWQRVDKLFKEYAWSLFNQGLSKVMIRMFSAVPEDVVNASPWMLHTRAEAYDLNGEAERRLRDLAELERYLDRLDNDPGLASQLSEADQLRLRTSLSRTRAFSAVLDNDFQAMIHHSDEALKYLPEDEYAVRGLTMGVRAQALWLMGDLEQSAAGMRDAIAISNLADARMARLVGQLGLGSIEVEWGHFDRAEDLYTSAVAFAEANGLADWQYTGRILSFQSEVPYEKNRLEEALDIATRGRELVGYWASRHAFDVSYLNLARVHYALGNLERARSLLRQSPPYTGIGPGLVVAAETEAFHAIVDLEVGERSTLAAIEADLLTPVSDLLDRIWLWTPVLRTRARLLNVLGRHDDAVGLAAPLFDICLERGWTRQAVQTGSVLANAYAGQGNRGAAVQAFDRVLELAEPRGFVRSILDAGGGIEDVIESAQRRRRRDGLDTTYLDVLLGIVRTEAQARGRKAAAPEQDLVEPLSERELEVLQLIAAGLTNADIADDLYVVVGTVKAHTHNIYSKLGVRNRTQAVVRGRELGLID